ncbi:hypothetical protein [Streptomyces sp. Je 1-369]|uniref:hypothetical protein n=1 Tax=Streptomyces sp. Je 1-369 TaxID=2966192 RepID=UPI002286CCC0|nr:hypothetical protein [Streptomyces sp. Je 1-369]WAL93856.1 hypothetical protein NOO62_04720 [Streptomyces sp. Je 1-369]
MTYPVLDEKNDYKPTSTKYFLSRTAEPELGGTYELQHQRTAAPARGGSSPSSGLPVLVAAGEHRLLGSERFAAGDFAGFPLVLTASDSTWWAVEIDADRRGFCVEWRSELNRACGR